MLGPILLDKLKKIQSSYDIDVSIKTTPKNVLNGKGDSGAGGDRSRQNASPFSIVTKSETREHFEDTSGVAFLQDPSPPSPPSYSCYHKNCEFHTDDEGETRSAKPSQEPTTIPNQVRDREVWSNPSG